MFRALKSPLEQPLKYVLRWLRPYGNQQTAQNQNALRSDTELYSFPEPWCLLDNFSSLVTQNIGCTQ